MMNRLRSTATIRQPAFVLHRRAYRESSLLLDLLTRDFGRVGAVVRGARGAGRGQGFCCQPLGALLVSWSGRGELKTLTAVERIGNAAEIGGERLYSALYVNEILVRLLPQHDAHPLLFDAYARLLAELPGAMVASSFPFFFKVHFNMMPRRLSRFFTVSVGVAPTPSQYITRDSFTVTVTGSVLGLYCPSFSRKRPSRL